MAWEWCSKHAIKIVFSVYFREFVGDSDPDLLGPSHALRNKSTSNLSKEILESEVSDSSDALCSNKKKSLKIETMVKITIMMIIISAILSTLTIFIPNGNPSTAQIDRYLRLSRNQIYDKLEVAKTNHMDAISSQITDFEVNHDALSLKIRRLQEIFS